MNMGDKLGEDGLETGYKRGLLEQLARTAMQDVRYALSQTEMGVPDGLNHARDRLGQLLRAIENTVDYCDAVETERREKNSRAMEAARKKLTDPPPSFRRTPLPIVRPDDPPPLFLRGTP